MIRDINGEILPYGKTKRTIEETFLATTTLPSWLTINGGTGFGYEIIPPSTSRGYLSVKTPNANNNGNVTLNILPNGIHMGHIKEIVLELDSLVFDSDKINLYISFQNSASTAGVEISDRYTTFNAVGKIGGVATNQKVNYHLRDFAGYNKRRNLSIRIRDDRTVILAEGDSVFFEHQFTPSQLKIDELIFPRIIAATTESVNHYVNFSRIAFSVIHN